METQETDRAVLAVLAVFLTVAGTAYAGEVVYVRAGAAGTNNLSSLEADPNSGRSWDDAFDSLHDAIAAALGHDTIVVAQGTYKPDYGTGITPGDRSAAYRLKNGITIMGGYAGDGPNAALGRTQYLSGGSWPDEIFIRRLLAGRHTIYDIRYTRT